MSRSFACVLLVIAIGIVCPSNGVSDVFPTANYMGGDLPAGFEASDIVWHSRLGRLFLVSDAGTVALMNSDGSNVTSMAIAGVPDLEGICVADPSSDFVYFGVEGSGSSYHNLILECDIVQQTVTRTFDLYPSMDNGTSKKGLEALTFVPDASNPEGGLFYAGLQKSGEIFKFELPIKSSSTSTSVTYEGKIAAYTDNISALHYDVDQQALYALYDGANVLRATTADGTLLKLWTSVPGSDQEGVALHDGVLYIVEDYGNSTPAGNVAAYSPFAGSYRNRQALYCLA